MSAHSSTTSSLACGFVPSASVTVVSSSYSTAITANQSRSHGGRIASAAAAPGVCASSSLGFGFGCASTGGPLNLTPRRHFASKYPEHIVLSMPALSPTMTKGNLAAWKKKEGEKVKAGDVLADVETDKATVAFESVEEGYLAKILIQAGAQDVPCGVPVAVLCEEQSAVAAFKDYAVEGKPAAPAPAASPAAAKTPSATPASASSSASSSSPSTSTGGDRVIASPLAKKTAAADGINLSEVKGTGPNQRILAADVQEFKVGRTAVSSTAAVSSGAAVVGGGVPVAGVDYTDVPLTSMRKVIAERLTYSKNSLPHFYTTVDIHMDRLLKLRQELNESQGDGPGAAKISVNDFIIKASALALRKVPAVNSGWIDGGNAIRQYAYVDISMAVATDTGLITPIIKDADLKGLATIATEAKALAAKARSNKLQLNEFQGGTFTISNLGMFGVKHFTAIINPPQSAILAVGSTESRVIANPNKNDQEKFISANFMHVTLSADHRVVDGAIAAQYLAALKKLMENPSLMML